MLERDSPPPSSSQAKQKPVETDAVNSNRYVEAFRRIGIDGSILGDLDDSTLESEVGIKLSLHRKKILTKVKALLANQ
jgi:hypothetical protein